MSDESNLSQITIRFDTTEELERANTVLADGEFCVEVLPEGGWYVKRGKQEGGKLLKWQELPYFSPDNIYGLREEINEILAAIAAEAEDRQAADNQLQANINAEEAARKAADAAEAEAREAADNQLQANIDTEAGTRADADALLQENIDTEAQAREDADAAEAEARKEADEALDAAVEAEARKREEADEHLQANIESESETRAAGDDQLQDDIDAEVASRRGADARLQAGIRTERSFRKAADAKHAALTIAHGATAYPSPNRIPLYGQDKKLHTGGPAAAYWDAVRFHEFKAALERIDDLEIAADDVLVTEEGNFITTETGVLLKL
jgi:hypothetical protein